MKPETYIQNLLGEMEFSTSYPFAHMAGSLIYRLLLTVAGPLILSLLFASGFFRWALLAICALIAMTQLKRSYYHGMTMRAAHRYWSRDPELCRTIAVRAFTQGRPPHNCALEMALAQLHDEDTGVC